ncbi:hypothetical protein DQ04_16241000 [Trypanosoma grayi]|uniref:hypothetical protein n=1 Tax=Trypanosoma grayi TaxID=71804 RepID=UPI0004F4613E|nr:hypothetical protein DQ04_16241000 [Trypanosoma grayi]KEG06055.1 hypothetical protein DQ04_16241000 [Trypanosoma grayi]
MEPSLERAPVDEDGVVVQSLTTTPASSARAARREGAQQQLEEAQGTAGAVQGPWPQSFLTTPQRAPPSPQQQPSPQEQQQPQSQPQQQPSPPPPSQPQPQPQQPQSQPQQQPSPQQQQQQPHPQPQPQPSPQKQQQSHPQQQEEKQQEHHHHHQQQQQRRQRPRHTPRRSARSVPSYGSVENTRDDATLIGGCNAQETLLYPFHGDGQNFGRKRKCLTFQLYDDERPVFKEVDTGSDSSVAARSPAAEDVEMGGLAAADVVPQPWIRGVTRHAVLFTFAAVIIGLSLLHNSLFATIDVVAGVERVAARQQTVKLALVFADAAAFSVFAPLVLLCGASTPAMPHILLVGAAVCMVWSGVCTMHGFAHGEFVLLVAAQLLHGVGLAGLMVPLLFFACVELGFIAGVPVLLFVAFHAGLASVTLGFFMFPAIAHRSSSSGISNGGTAEAVRVFLYATCTVPLFAFGICALLPSASCVGAARTFRRFVSARGLREAVSRVDSCFLLRCLACGCIFAVACLTVAWCKPLLSPHSSSSSNNSNSNSNGDDNDGDSMGGAVHTVGLMLLFALASLPLCLVPLFGPVVRFYESGPAAAAVVGVVTAFLGTNAPLPLWATALYGVSLAVPLAGLMRSLAGVRWGFSGLVPLLMLTFVLSVCAALALGVSALLLSARLRTGSASSNGAHPQNTAMWQQQQLLQDVRDVLLVTASAAMLLQGAAALRMART